MKTKYFKIFLTIPIALILFTTHLIAGEFCVNQYTNGNQEEPDIAMDGAGNFVIVYQNKQTDYSWESYEIYVGDLTAKGKKKGGSLR
ncbi:hypothetical protein KKB18_00570 [bacterium]|nr:hypothetical protein [bacterium]